MDVDEMIPCCSLWSRKSSGAVPAMESSVDNLCLLEAQRETTDVQSSVKLLPILIIPGFMSSALKVTESVYRPDWIGRRLWISLTALGFSSFQRLSDLLQNERKREAGDVTGYSNEMHEEYREQLHHKNDWVQHMSLASDRRTDRQGIKVRAMYQGLDAVDYLTPGLFTERLTYVFGPVIKALESYGYKESQNLDAAPYDWRLPPCELESRDGYFTTTMRKVEQLYNLNDGTPVVILTHSMGCQTGHYFFNFAKRQINGQAWLDKHIHSFMPVGGLHLGAPSSLRALVSGDKFALDPFLGVSEKLAMGRSFGSTPWMFPGQLPRGAPPTAFMRNSDVVDITVHPFDCTQLLQDLPVEHMSSSRYRLTFVLNKRTILSTAYKAIPLAGCLPFTEHFHFAVPANDKTFSIQVRLQKSSLLRTTQKSGAVTFQVILTALMCILRYTVLIPLTIRRMLNTDFPRSHHDVPVKETESHVVTIASSQSITVRKLRSRSAYKDAGQDISMQLQLPRRGVGWMWVGKHQMRTKIHVQWQRRPSNDTKFSTTDPVSVSVPSTMSPSLSLMDNSGKFAYEAIRGDELFKLEGLNPILNLIRTCYDTDKLGPRTISTFHAPPVRRVKAVYGINVPTEVGTVYKPASVVVEKGKVVPRHEPDKSVRVALDSGFLVEDGIIYETEQTKNIDINGNIIRRSGDGTVPYWSLQHCRTWHSRTCQVEVNEMEGVNHREILADARFHELLRDYVQVKL